MGTASTKKFLKQNAGALTEEAALTTSVGAGDAHRIPALNDSGVLDASIINGTTVSAGASSAGKTPVLGGDGRLNPTMMPVGVDVAVSVMTASEALVAGNFVNVWNSTGAKVRKADAATAGKEAHGFVLSAVASGATGAVYFEGTNTAVTGQTPGVVYLSATAGLATATAPSAAGQVVQRLGIAISATEIQFEAALPIVLA